MMRRVLRFSLSMSLVACTACAPLMPATLSTIHHRTVAQDLVHIGAMSNTTAFEASKHSLDQPDGTTTANEGATTNKATQADDLPTDSDKRQRRRRALFWTGVGISSVGALGTVGFMVGGRVIQSQHSDGYANSELTYAEEDRLKRQGNLMNGLAIGSAVVGLIGVGLAAITYGIDHARCGDLPPKRKRCPKRPAQTATADRP